MSTDPKNLEKMDRIVKLSERKINSLSNLKNKIINMRSLETHFNDKTFIMKNCFELEEGLKQEIHSASIMFDEIKEIATSLLKIDSNYFNLEKEYNKILNEKKVLNDKLTDYDKELIVLRDQVKIYETELRMKDREGGKLDTNVNKLKNNQETLKSENSNLKIRLHDSISQLNKTKKFLEEMLNLHLNFASDHNIGKAALKQRQLRMKRVSEIVHKLNISKELFSHIANKVGTDFLGSLTLMRCEDSFIEKIEKIILAYEVVESKDVLELIEYEKEQIEKSKMNEISLFDKDAKQDVSKIKQKTSFNANIDYTTFSKTPKRGFQNKLSLDSPQKKLSSMENYTEFGGNKNEPSDFNLGGDSDRISKIESSNSLSKKPSQTSMTNASNVAQSSKRPSDQNSPQNKSRFKTLFPEAVPRSPTKIFKIPIPEVEIKKRKSMLDVKLEKENEFDAIKDDYEATKDAIKRQSTFNNK